jgi:hypothetical protein
VKRSRKSPTWVVEGIANTPALVLIHAPRAPRSVTLGGRSLADFEYAPSEDLLWIRFDNQAQPRELSVHF